MDLNKVQVVDLVREKNELIATANKERKNHTATYLSVIALLVGLLCFLLYLAFVRFPRDSFIATQNAAAICRISPIDRPHIAVGQVTDFAQSAVVSIYTYNYLTYKKNAAETADTYFSNEFHEPFLRLFSTSKALQEVIDKRFNVIAVGTANQPPLVTRAGPRNGAWAWVVDVPVTVYYISGRDTHEDKILASVTVTQVDPTRTNPKGIAVDDIVLRQALNN